MLIKGKCRNCQKKVYFEPLNNEVQEDMLEGIERGDIDVDLTRVMLHRCSGSTSFYPSGIIDIVALVESEEQ